MIKKLRAMKLYREMLTNLTVMNEARKAQGRYDGIDRGFAILPEEEVTEELLTMLSRLASKDGFEFIHCPAYNSLTCENVVVLSIDREPLEEKLRQLEEMQRIIAEKDDKPEVDPKVILFSEYKARKS